MNVSGRFFSGGARYEFVGKLSKIFKNSSKIDEKWDKNKNSIKNRYLKIINWWG